MEKRGVGSWLPWGCPSGPPPLTKLLATLPRSSSCCGPDAAAAAADAAETDGTVIAMLDLDLFLERLITYITSAVCNV
jgi:hypothetical protein